MSETTSARIEPPQGPPEAFGMRWEYAGTWDTERGKRHLWKSRDNCIQYEDALRAHRPLRDGGFSAQYLAGSRDPRFWETPGYDRAALAEECRVAIEEGIPLMRAADREKRVLKMAKAAAAAEELRTRPARAIEQATDSLRRPWAWSRQSDIETATALLALGDALDADQAALLLSLASRATANVDRALNSMRTPHAREAALAADPAIQAAALEGCRLMSTWDGDRASVQNGQGWGKTSSVRGHVLSGQESLDAAMASHALAILRTHRRQLPADLQTRLFETVPQSAVA